MKICPHCKTPVNDPIVKFHDCSVAKRRVTEDELVTEPVAVASQRLPGSSAAGRVVKSDLV